jgi:hydrogenase expression/formation protein HypE
LSEKEDPPVIDPYNLSCPAPIQQRSCIVLGHGSGGRLTHELISRYFYRFFSNPILAAGNDGGIVPSLEGQRLVVSADSHVVWPLFFPGGDIGRLAVCGTVNDVAMMGAMPLYLTAGFILEEGLDLVVLERVLKSMQEAADEAQVQIVAGDTKVVQRSKADGLYITTTGLGTLPLGRDIGGHLAQPGDQIILSGPIGDHGIAVLSARGELGFEASVQSDVAPLNHLTTAMLQAGSHIHVLRDPTRGGIATTLNEIARQSRVGIVLSESQIPIRPAVKAACEMLGFDPLYVANEGKLLAVVASTDTDVVLKAMRHLSYGAEAVLIGEVRAEPIGRVLMKTAMGSHRIVDVLSGEMLPRIC